MDATELVESFQREIHQEDNVPRVDTGDIVYFLNKAQENFVKDKFAGKRSSRDGFEESQDLIDDLRTLYRKDCVTQTIYGGESAHARNAEVDQAFLPSDYVHLVSARARVHVSTDIGPTGDREEFTWQLVQADYKGDTYQKRTASPSQTYDVKTVPVAMKQSQRIYGMLASPFHSPTHSRPLSDLNNDRINVYTNTAFIVDAVLINYIRSPQSITLDGEGQTSELPEELHREIVTRAVRLFLQTRPTQPSNSNQQDE
jgi:hypothetical protein